MNFTAAADKPTAKVAASSLSSPAGRGRRKIAAQGRIDNGPPVAVIDIGSNSVRLVVYVTDMYRFRPFVNKVQEELWGAGPYPPRTIVEVHRLNGDDICEVEGTFYAPSRK